MPAKSDKSPRSMKAVQIETERLWRKGFVEQMGFKSWSFYSRGHRWWERKRIAMRWHVQDDVNKESEQNEVDGMKKGADFTGDVMHIKKSNWWLATRKILMVELEWQRMSSGFYTLLHVDRTERDCVCTQVGWFWELYREDNRGNNGTGTLSIKLYHL